jgi:hypothetical protein
MAHKSAQTRRRARHSGEYREAAEALAQLFSNGFLSACVIPFQRFRRMLLSQARQVITHSSCYVVRRRSTTYVAKNFTPQSIGTGEHLTNDSVDDRQVTAGLVIRRKFRPTVAQINGLARQHTREARQGGINKAVKCENARGAFYQLGVSCPPFI